MKCCCWASPSTTSRARRHSRSRSRHWSNRPIWRWRAAAFAEAEQKFRAALTLQPDLPPLRYSLAFCALQAGRLADAEAQFRSLVDAVPDFFLGHIGLAIVHLSRHEPEKAEAAIAPLRQKSELHVVEFSTLCQAEVDILLSQGKRSAARLWAEAWSGMVDDVPSFNELVRIHQRTYGG